MRNHHWWPVLRLVAASLVAVTIIAGPTRGQQESSASSTQHPSKGTDPVVRTFGAQGGFRTEVTSQTRGSLSEDDRRQISTLDGPGVRTHREGAGGRRCRRQQAGPRRGE